MKENMYNLSPHRRTYERFLLEGSADVMVDEKSIPSILKDLSVRGAGVILNQSLGIDKEVTIFIKASAFMGSTYKKARVVWCKAVTPNLYAAGLDFGLFNQLDFA